MIWDAVGAMAKLTGAVADLILAQAGYSKSLVSTPNAIIQHQRNVRIAEAIFELILHRRGHLAW
jgi:hypothetical protein